jgi:signal transduction histidine kinase
MITLSIGSMVNGISSLGLALFVLSRRPLTPRNTLWALFCFSVALWCIGFSRLVSAPNAAVALWWESRVMYIGCLLIPIFFFHFCLLFLDLRRPVWLWIGYGMCLVLNVININYGIVGVREFPPLRYYATPGHYCDLFTAYFFIYVTYSHALLWAAFRRSTGNIQRQIFYVQLGTGIGFIGGSTSFFPTYGFNFVPYAVNGVFAYILTATYGIIRHHLLDIKVVIRRAVLYSIISTALIALYVAVMAFLARSMEGVMASRGIYVSAFIAGGLALLFDPLRRRLQSRFERPRYARQLGDRFLHEIKMPLSNISLPAELSVQDLRDLQEGVAPVQETSRRVEQRMRMIMDQAQLAAYRLEAVQETLTGEGETATAVSLSKIVQRSLDLLADPLKSDHVDVQVKPLDDLPPVHAKPNQLEIACTNLLKNAVESMHANADDRPRVLTVDGNTHNEWVHLSISDTGPGISPEERGKIFMDGFSTKAKAGRGIGLALVKEIVAGLGGRITLGEPSKQGAQFVLRLPRHES